MDIWSAWFLHPLEDTVWGTPCPIASWQSLSDESCPRLAPLGSPQLRWRSISLLCHLIWSWLLSTIICKRRKRQGRFPLVFQQQRQKLPFAARWPWAVSLEPHSLLFCSGQFHSYPYLSDKETEPQRLTKQTVRDHTANVGLTVGWCPELLTINSFSTESRKPHHPRVWLSFLLWQKQDLLVGLPGASFLTWKGPKR